MEGSYKPLKGISHFTAEILKPKVMTAFWYIVNSPVVKPTWRLKCGTKSQCHCHLQFRVMDNKVWEPVLYRQPVLQFIFTYSMEQSPSWEA